MPRRQWQENSFYLLFGTIADVDREKLDLCLPEMDFLRGDTHKKKSMGGIRRRRGRNFKYVFAIFMERHIIQLPHLLRGFKLSRFY